MSTLPARSETDLTDNERRELQTALLRLRSAVAAYEPFTGGELEAGKPVPVHDLKQMSDAQAEVEAAERELWQLRERFLGWMRPASAPPAGLVADWFSEDDAIYDEASTPSAVTFK